MNPISAEVQSFTFSKGLRVQTFLLNTEILNPHSDVHELN